MAEIRIAFHYTTKMPAKNYNFIAVLLQTLQQGAGPPAARAVTVDGIGETTYTYRWQQQIGAASGTIRMTAFDLSVIPC